MLRKSFWQIVREEFWRKQIFVECADNRCIHNNHGNCNKNNANTIIIDENRKCTSFDFE